MVSYLLPTIQKRLLRYALSRSELLDTDALDLDNLDIAWGHRSTVELRDVALRLGKLSSLLHLPSNLELQKARILLLRLTVPADIYQSSIIIDVEGVDVQIRERSPVRPQPSETIPVDKQGQTSVRADQADPAPSRPSVNNTSGGPVRFSGEASLHENEDDHFLPTSEDLATSFLQTEPEIEKAQLKAVIATGLESRQLSLETSLTDEEVEVGAGTGTVVGLPTFLANFLKGVGDRLLVNVRGLEIQLDVELRPDGSTGEGDLVTVLLAAEEIYFGAANMSQVDFSSAIPAAIAPATAEGSREGAKCVRLVKIHVSLISDAAVFAATELASGHASLLATRSDLSGGQASSRSSRTGTEIGSPAIQSARSPAKVSHVRQHESSETEVPMALERNRRSMTPPPHVLSHSVASTDGGRFDDLDEDCAESLTRPRAILQDPFRRPEESLSHKSTGRGIITSESSLDDILDARGHAHRASAFTVERPILTTEPKTLIESSSQRRLYEPTRTTQSRSSYSVPSIPTRSVQDLLHVAQSTTHDPERLDEDDGIESGVEEDLSQSKFFSHEEAESMYMSAMSQDPELSQDSGIDESSAIESLCGRENLDALDRPMGPRNFSINKSAPEEEIESGVATSQTDTPEEVPATVRSRHSKGLSTRSNSYSKISKHLLDISQVTIRLDDAQSAVDELAISGAPMQPDLQESTSLAASVSDESRHFSVPGAFSMYASVHRPRRPVETPPAPRVSSTRVKPSSELKSVNAAFATEIEVGNVEARLDLSIAHLALKLVQQLSIPEQNEAVSVSSEPPDSADQTRWRFHAESISLQLLERVIGITKSSEATTSSRSTIREGFAGGGVSNGDVLLQTTLQDLGVEATTSLTSSQYVFWTGKVACGYSDDDIISFDHSTTTSASTTGTSTAGASTRGVSVSFEKEIRGTISRSSETRRLSVTTLPIHISLNLPRLDETLSWFGGFSGILGMGSSIASTATLTKPTSSRPIPQSRSRGVHFVASADCDDADSASTLLQSKVDLRMGGMAIEVIGRESRVQLQSTAWKLVSREQGIGVQIDNVNVSGPYLAGTTTEVGFQTDLRNIRVEYLPRPKEVDLGRLLALLTPSHNGYGQDDDIILDTLLRQRRQGAVLRVTVAAVQSRISRLEELSHLSTLGDELSKLSTVTKYLPEDDRPGVLLLGLIRQIDGHVLIDDRIGSLSAEAQNIEIAHVNLPSLSAFSVESIQVHRNDGEDIIGKALANPSLGPAEHYPMVMVRMIGDEIEPTIKVKLCNVRVEYRVPTLMAFLHSPENPSSEELLMDLRRSVVALADQAETPSPKQATSSPKQGTERSMRRPPKVDIRIRDCIVGLNPSELPSRGLVVLTETRFVGSVPIRLQFEATLDISKASLLIIDDVAHIRRQDELGVSGKDNSAVHSSEQISQLSAMGFVPVSYMSSARAVVRLVEVNANGERTMDVEFKDDLLVLESCADSTQTLIGILNGLKPPTPKSVEIKYRTEVIPVQDMLASLSGHAFDSVTGREEDDEDHALDLDEEGDLSGDDQAQDMMGYGVSFEASEVEAVSPEITDSIVEEDIGIDDLDDLLESIEVDEGLVEISPIAGDKEAGKCSEEPLDFLEDHFGYRSDIEGRAHEWNSTRNTYGNTEKQRVQDSPVKVRVRDVHVIWNLYDGYDWQSTRDTIAKTAEEMENKALERRARNDRRTSKEDSDDEDESEIGDFLFNSIYIGIPAKVHPSAQDDLPSDTSSQVTAATTSGAPATDDTRHIRLAGRKLRLTRSRSHQMSFELRGISLDLVIFPPGTGETQSSIDVRIDSLEIFDLVPTSTWKKFATYMHDAGDREMGSHQIHLEMLNVRPVVELSASELILKVHVLPLRLHVDQDALDFLTRFFEFKPSPPNTAVVTDTTESTASEEVFIQRCEIHAIPLKLDYKPKTIDYPALRSGHTTEFMNFFILDGSVMTLRHVIIYGVSGFAKLGQTLNDIWMPDIKRTQLPGVLAGLAPVRNLVTAGAGVRDLIMVPVREYRKDGRVIRAVGKGMGEFSRGLGGGLVKLGAKLAIGTQTVLQGAEDFLNPAISSPSPPASQEQPSSGSMRTRDEESADHDRRKQISPYADQPFGVLAGLSSAYHSLERDLATTRDVIIAIPGEVMEAGSATAAIGVVLKRAPTVVLRPAIGGAKAVGKVMLGVGQGVDSRERRRVEDKYKKH